MAYYYQISDTLRLESTISSSNIKTTLISKTRQNDNIEELACSLNSNSPTNSMNSLNKEVTEFLLLYNRIPPAMPTTDPKYCNYKINVDDIVFEGYFSTIYLATNNDFPEIQLIARVFEPSAHINPKKCSFLSLLKHLGKRSKFLINNWDIFYDNKNRVVFFQEYAKYGNLLEFIRNNVQLIEPQLFLFGYDIYKGMQFLNKIGFCHGGISPKHILLTSGSKPNAIVAKLGSFRDTIIYYDATQPQCIRRQKCRSTKSKNDGFFDAPEIYNDKTKSYDPIAADVWSYGATLFWSLTRTYPFNIKQNTSNINDEIKNNIDSKNISPEAKNLFNALLNADYNKRTTFDKILKDPWYKYCKKLIFEDQINMDFIVENKPELSEKPQIN